MTLRDMHVIFIMLPERSSFHGSFKLAKELRSAGARVTYIGPQSYQGFVAAQKLSYVPLLPEPYQPEEPLAAGHWPRRTWSRLRAAQRAFERYFAGLSAPLDALGTWLDEHSPSIALLEPMMWEFSPPLLRARIPIVGLSNTLTAKLDTRFPPVFSSTVAMNEPTLAARLIYAGQWGRAALQFGMQHAIESLQMLSFAGPSAFAAERPSARVRQSGGELCFGEYGYRLRIPELVLAPKEIDFPQTTRQANRNYAGSCVDVERRDMPFEWGAIEKDQEIVYCSLGTYNHFYAHTGQLFRAVIEAILRKPHLQAIVHVGSAAMIAELGPQPARVRLLEQAPQLEILRHASVFITHGGIGAVREGLFFGVPMIVFPCWLDQFGNAARLVHHGVAVRGDRSIADTDLVERLLAEAQSPAVRKATERMRNTFRAQEACEDGVRWIESHVRNSSTRS